MNIFMDFQRRVAGLLAGLAAAGALPGDLDLGRFVVEPPRDPAHGDLSTNAAMVYAKEAKAAGSNPRALAERIVAGLAGFPDVAEAEVAGPGFINIRLKPEVYTGVLRAVLREGGRYGARRPTPRGRSMSNMSAPTRPARCMSAMRAARCSATRSRACSPFPGAR